MEWSPPSTTGVQPWPSASSTACASSLQVSVISGRYLARLWPKGIISGTRTEMLPRSSTE